MNKKLVAVAVAGVLAAPLAAQAQTANVTLYGRLNLTAEVVKAQQSDGSNPNQYRVSSNSSRLGVRGTESLGGGLNAIFQIESNVSADTGGGLLGTRETFAGLQGSWGTLKIGNFLAPYDDIHPIFGNVPTLTTSIMSTASVWAQGYLGKTSGGFDARLGNSVRYDSPNISGFTGGLQISQLDGSTGQGGVTYGDIATARRHAYVLSTGVYYNNGPVQVGMAYEANNKVRGPGLSDWAFSLAGSWNFGFMKVGAVFEKLDYDTPAGTSTASLTRNFWAISGTFNVGPGQIYTYYGRANDGGGGACDINTLGCTTRVGGLARGNNTGSNDYEISYTYPLSKRTLTYTGYHRIQNDSRASYNFNINSIAGTDDAKGGFKPTGFVVGVVHFF